MTEENQTPSDELQLKIQTLEKQNTKLTKSLDNTKNLAASFDGLDPIEARAAIQFKADSDRKQLEAAGDYKNALQAETDKFTKAINIEQEKVKNITTQLESTLIDGAISVAISNAGGKPRALHALINEEKLVRVVNEDGQLVARVFAKDSDTPRIKPDSNGLMNVDDLVRELASDSELAGLFPPSGNSGGGASPSQTNTNTTTNNSVKNFKGNLTEIAKTFKTNLGV